MSSDQLPRATHITHLTVRGLVSYRREYAPGFWTDVVAWESAEHFRRR
jgi:hypothetical protein